MVNQKRVDYAQGAGVSVEFLTTQEAYNLHQKQAQLRAQAVPPAGTGATKFDDGKIRFELVPGRAFEEVAKVFTYGAKKYGPNQWLAGEGMPYSRIFGALMRHSWQWFNGQNYDTESGCHHLAHAAANCLMLAEYLFMRTGKDDRC